MYSAAIAEHHGYGVIQESGSSEYYGGWEDWEEFNRDAPLPKPGVLSVFLQDFINADDKRPFKKMMEDFGRRAFISLPPRVRQVLLRQRTRIYKSIIQTLGGPPTYTQVESVLFAYIGYVAITDQLRTIYGSTDNENVKQQVKDYLSALTNFVDDVEGSAIRRVITSIKKIIHNPYLYPEDSPIRANLLASRQNNDVTGRYWYEGLFNVLPRIRNKDATLPDFVPRSQRPDASSTTVPNQPTAAAAAASPSQPTSSPSSNVWNNPLYPNTPSDILNEDMF